MRRSFFFIFLLIFCTTSLQQKPIGCFIWKNSFVHFQNETTSQNNKNVIIKIKSKQRTGWIGIGLLKKPNDFSNSFQIVAYSPQKIIQLTNHTKVVLKKTIFEEFFDNINNNRIDGLLSFSFKINSSEIFENNFLYFSQNEIEIPTENNITITIPKHQKRSNAIYFQLNTTYDILECSKDLNMPGRIFAYHPSIFFVSSIAYLFVVFLLVLFRNHQPLKSRFLGPMIGLVLVYLNNIGEFFFYFHTYEQTSKYYCELTGFFIYPTIQTWYV